MPKTKGTKRTSTKKTSYKKRQYKKPRYTVSKEQTQESWVHWNTQVTMPSANVGSTQFASGCLLVIPANPYLCQSGKFFSCIGATGTQALVEITTAKQNGAPPTFLSASAAQYQRVKVKKMLIDIAPGGYQEPVAGTGQVYLGDQNFQVCSHYEPESVTLPAVTVNSLDQIAQSWADCWFQDLSVYKGTRRYKIVPEPVQGTTLTSIHKNGYVEAQFAQNVDYGQVFILISYPQNLVYTLYNFHLNVSFKLCWDTSRPTALGALKALTPAGMPIAVEGVDGSESDEEEDSDGEERDAFAEHMRRYEKKLRKVLAEEKAKSS